MEPTDALKYAYYSTDSPACFSGLEPVFREALRHCPHLTRNEVKEWLSRQRTYTQYRPSVRKFRRLRTVPSGLNTDWQADLTMFNALKAHNDGYEYILVCVDVLSRTIYAEPVRRKTAAAMIPAFEAIFERAGTLPWKLFTDRGNEFESGEMKAYFRRKDILKFAAHTFKKVKATVAERANRTIKDRLYKYFSKRNTLRWLDILPKLVDAINRSVCRSTGMRPIDVTEENAPELKRRLYGGVKPSFPKKTRFNVGDSVRIAKQKALFTKGLARYSDIIYTVAEVLGHKRPVVYRLKDYFNQPLKGYFYERELVKTVPFHETGTRIDHVLARRTRGGVREVLIRWLNHGPEYDSWIPEAELAQVGPAADRNLVMAEQRQD